MYWKTLSVVFTFRVFHVSKLLFCFAIFVTYMLCFYVPMDFLEPPLLRWLNIDKTMKAKKLSFHVIFRSTIVAITGKYTCHKVFMANRLYCMCAIHSHTIHTHKHTAHIPYTMCTVLLLSHSWTCVGYSKA